MQDHSSFAAFYGTTRDRLLRQLTVMTTDPEQAKDALQEAYSRAWQRWARVSRMDDPAAWVRTVAWRVAVSHHRRSAVAAKVLPRLRGDAAATLPPPDEVLDVQQALRRLRPEQRRVLVLHHVAGLPVEAIAEETGVAVGTVKSRLARARAALARELGPSYQQPTGNRLDLVPEPHEERS